jgi:ferredoxin
MLALEPSLAVAVSRAPPGGLTVLRILIDPVACDAYGYCAELLPEAISLDEWGYPIVDGKPLPPELVETARRAARDCPRRAITLRERKGGH